MHNNSFNLQVQQIPDAITQSEVHGQEQEAHQDFINEEHDENKQIQQFLSGKPQNKKDSNMS